MSQSTTAKNAPPPPPDTTQPDPLWNDVQAGIMVPPQEPTDSEWQKRRVGNSHDLLHNRTHRTNGYHRATHESCAYKMAEEIENEKQRHYPKRYSSLPALRKGNGEPRINIGKDAVDYILRLTGEDGMKDYIKRCVMMQLHRGRETLIPADIQISGKRMPGWDVPNIFHPNDYQMKQGARYYKYTKCVDGLQRIRKQRKHQQERSKEEKEQRKKEARRRAMEAMEEGASRTNSAHRKRNRSRSRSPSASSGRSSSPGKRSDSVSSHSSSGSHGGGGAKEKTSRSSPQKTSKGKGGKKADAADAKDKKGATKSGTTKQAEKSSAAGKRENTKGKSSNNVDGGSSAKKARKESTKR
jgi:hypothetical protein